MALVSFFNADVKYKIQGKKLLKEFIPQIFNQEIKVLESISIILCSDEHLLAMNKQFLNHDYYTDILTFDLSSDKTIVSEIYISIDRIKENASKHSTLFQVELNRIIFHGVLHLCGFGDKSKKEKNLMTLKENEYLEKYLAFHVKQ